MNDRGWEDLVDRIDVNFGIEHMRKLEEPLEDDSRLKAQVEQIDFIRQGVTYRVERRTSPAILDKKTNYNKTGIATSAHVTYDPTELTHKVGFYRLDGENAVEIAPEELLH